MEIIQEIGSYAGFAAVLGLAVLSALYFSQARDVKRLREWAGRAPERGPVQAPQAQRVVAQPIARPGQPVPLGRAAPAVPRPPGTQPAGTVPKPAAAAAAGAAPAVAKGPAPATPAAASVAGADQQSDDDSAGENGEAVTDVTALETEVHTPADVASDEECDDGSTGDEEAVDPAPAVDGEDRLDGEDEPDTDGREDEAPTGPAEPDEDTLGETGEWSPEDEHSEIDFTDEHDVVPATPAASAPRPPQPPRPFPRRTGATVAGRPGRTILPPYEESRPTAEKPSRSRGSRRPILLVAGGLAARAIAALAILQIAGGDDSGDTTGGIAASTSESDNSPQEPIDRATVTVAVLNGTTVPGLAATLGDRIADLGFQQGTVTNSFDQERAESVVLFAPGAEREAIAVSRQLDIPQREPIDPDSQALAGDATVVVVAGADQNQ